MPQMKLFPPISFAQNLILFTCLLAENHTGSWDLLQFHAEKIWMNLPLCGNIGDASTILKRRPACWFGERLLWRKHNPKPGYNCFLKNSILSIPCCKIFAQPESALLQFDLFRMVKFNRGWGQTRSCQPLSWWPSPAGSSSSLPSLSPCMSRSRLRTPSIRWE